MNSTKGNIIYTIFLCIVIPISVFFIVYPIIYSSIKEKNYSADYNKAMALNSYRIKISDAVYITDTDQFVFTFSILAESNAKEEARPYISDFETYTEKNKATSYAEGYEYVERSNISQYVYIPDVINNFRYVRVYATSTIPEYQDPPTTDEFGDEIPGQIHEAVTKGQYCQIDKNDIKFMTAKEAAKYLIKKSDESEDMSLANESSDTENHSYIDVQITSGTSLSTTTTAVSEPSVQTSSNTSNSSESNQNSNSGSVSNSDTPIETNAPSNENGGGNVGGGGGGGGGVVWNDPEPTETTMPPTTTAAPQTTPTPATSQPQTTRPQTTRPPETTPEIIHANRIYIESDFENNIITLNINGETQLRAIVEPDNAADKSIKWTSNKPEIADVDANGKIKAKSKGKAIITAETVDGGLKASCMITIN